MSDFDPGMTAEEIEQMAAWYESERREAIDWLADVIDEIDSLRAQQEEIETRLDQLHSRREELLARIETFTLSGE